MKLKRGFSLLELILAVAIFSLSSFALATMLIDTTVGTKQILERIDAMSYAREGISKVQNLRDCGYFSILDHGSDYGITGDCESGYELVSGGETVYNNANEETIYNRTYSFSDFGLSTSTKNFSVTVEWDSIRSKSVTVHSLVSGYDLAINDSESDGEIVVGGGEVDPNIQIVTNLRVGLVGYWPLDDTSETIASDESGNNNDGNINGGVLVNQTGKVGKSMYFDGTNDYIKLINNSANFPVGDTSRTVAVWMKPTTQRGTAMWYGYYGTNYQEMDMEVGYPAGGRVYWQRYGSDLQSSAITSDGNWHFVVYRYSKEEGNISNIWVDGIKVSSDVARALATPSSEASIGASLRAGSVSFYYQGLLDEVGIWNRALTTQEISDLYNGESGRSLVQ